MNWNALEAELGTWRAEGLTLPFWWRDDDTTEPTAALDRLYGIATSLDLPLHLAVIPEPATEELGQWLNARGLAVPLVHGWAHRNHEPPERKKAEFGIARPVETALEDAREGWSRLGGLLGHAPAPLFVPPWNRISPEVADGLRDIGYRALSTFGPRKNTNEINTHLDPIDWRGTRSVVAPDKLLDQAVALLADRRQGRADNSEPFGLLTHHLVHDPAIWDFTETFLRLMADGPVRPWRATELESN